MNFNAIIAVLVLKNVITKDEGQHLVEHLNDKPQSTVLKDAILAVAEVIGQPAQPGHTGVAFGQPATDEPAKPMSDKKPKEDTAKK